MLSHRTFVLAGLAAALCHSAAAQLGWQPLPPFPAPAREIAAVAAAGKIYAFAGLGDRFTPLGLVFAYDPATRSWTKKKPMPLPAHGVALAEAGGKIYLFGGFKKPAAGTPAWEPIDNSWEYNPADDSWKPLKPLPSPRGSASAASVNGKIYVMGGAAVQPGAKNVPLLPGPAGTPSRSLDSVDEYDPATNSWRPRTTMPTPRNHFALAAVDGKFYALGGRTGSAFADLASELQVVEQFDPATNQWGLERAKMSTIRDSMAAAVYDGHICLIGGSMTDARVSASFRTAEAYDAAKDQWLVLPPVPIDRSPVTAAVLGDTLYLISAPDGYKLQTGEYSPSDGSPFDALRIRMWP